MSERVVALCVRVENVCVCVLNRYVSESVDEVVCVCVCVRACVLA